ncbi:unnamed protein product [Ceutorhynchus assimilis]|uniref:Uncharacterized protein n=1 Tax=Ceutorhynchus assimilis TaxID=467358 RepID=A0A9N9QLA2_9CUCU|nr:unnamed protein product [Ceutorhynchus assimilis]
MATNTRICFLCDKKNDKIVLFTNDKLVKCREVLKVRIKNKFKYSDVQLPVEVNATHGYHAPRYRAFTAVATKYFTQQMCSTESAFSTLSAQKKSIHILMSPTASTSDNASCNIPDYGVVSMSPMSLNTIEFSEKPTDASTSTISTVDKQSNVSISQKSAINPELSHASSSTSAGTSPSVQTIILDLSIDNSGKLCIFCNKNSKKVNGVVQKLIAVSTEQIVGTLQQRALDLDDQDLLNGLQDKNLVYHVVCERTYKSNDRTVTEKGQSVTFSHEVEPRHFETSVLTPLIKDKKIKIIMKNKKKVIVPYDGFILGDEEFANLATQDLLHRAAIILREQILSIQRKKLPKKLYAKDLIDGECDIPDELEDFFQTLLADPGKKRRKTGADCLRKSKSFAEDIIYAVHNGKIKTAKHITLGMTIKSLTNSRKVINILNRYGHICSYNTLEEFETEVTIISVERSKICPDDIILSPHLCTGVAFNNFDRFVDTRTGKDTLHDTVGIIYQNIDQQNNDSDVELGIESEPRYELARENIEIGEEVKAELQNYQKKIISMEDEDSVTAQLLKKYKDYEEATMIGVDEFSTTEYIIAGLDQARGVEFSREMSNIKFKEALVKFLSMHWSSTEATPFIGNKIINLNFDLCYRFEVINGEVVKTTDDQLICEGYEEADTKIVYHICKLDTGSRILIKANDTDILIIMLGNMKHIKDEHVEDPTKEIEDDKEIHRDSDGDEDDEEDEIINADESSDF